MNKNILLFSLLLFNSAHADNIDKQYFRELRKLERHSRKCFSNKDAKKISFNMKKVYLKENNFKRRDSLRVLKIMNEMKKRSKTWFPSKNITCSYLTKSVCEAETILNKLSYKNSREGCLAFKYAIPAHDRTCDKLVRTIQKKVWEMVHWNPKKSDSQQVYPALPKRWVKNSCGLGVIGVSLLIDSMLRSRPR